jgi:hypothetical protein
MPHAGCFAIDVSARASGLIEEKAVVHFWVWPERLFDYSDRVARSGATLPVILHQRVDLRDLPGSQIEGIRLDLSVSVIKRARICSPERLASVDSENFLGDRYV